MARPVKNPSVSRPVNTPRRKGRPTEHATVGRETLIEVTQELLRKTPPDRLTMAEISAAANVTPALIRYYFGGKEGLFMAAASAQLDALQQKGQAAVDKGGSLKSRLAERLLGMVGQVQENPHFHKLIMDAVYSGSTKESETLTSQAASRGLMLTLSLLHGTDEPLRKVDPRFLHIAMIGMTEFFGSSEVFLQQLFGKDEDPEALRQRYVDFLVDLLLHGLTRPA